MGKRSECASDSGDTFHQRQTAALASSTDVAQRSAACLVERYRSNRAEWEVHSPSSATWRRAVADPEAERDWLFDRTRSCCSSPGAGGEKRKTESPLTEKPEPLGVPIWRLGANTKPILSGGAIVRGVSRLARMKKLVHYIPSSRHVANSCKESHSNRMLEDKVQSHALVPLERKYQTRS